MNKNRMVGDQETLPHILMSRFSESDNARPSPIFSDADRWNALDKFSRNSSETEGLFSDSQKTVLQLGLVKIYLKTEAKTGSTSTFFRSLPNTFR